MAKNSIPQVPQNPLQRIALCMSGGGYRAATFQIGMMSYLNSKKLGEETLLEKVKAISTVSGGTIIGVYYATMVQEGVPFKDIYTNFVNWINNTDLVKEGLEKVSPKGNWRYDYKRKNIINAFAELYDETLLDHKTMAVFDDMTKSHLDYVCFNTTEFLKGYRFRFQAGEHTRQFGSNDLRISKKLHKHFRLGDIMAASSGFSGGFEPISMPDDFLDPKSEVHQTLSEKLKKKGGPIGIMDGGIYDNQGVSSIESYQDYAKVKDFDLLLFSDVSSPYLDAFRFTDEKSGGIREKTYNQLKKTVKKGSRLTSLLLLFISIGGLVMLFMSNFQSSTLYGAGLATLLFGIIILGAWLIFSAFMAKKWRDLLNFIGSKIPPYFFSRLPAIDIKNIPIKTLEVLASDRLNSLKLLLPDVFLKQVRRLHYNRIFTDEKYTYRRSACLIKELTEVDYKQKSRNDYAFMKKHNLGFEGKTQKDIVGKKILHYTTSAASFGTTLWFTDDEKLDKMLKALVISGQISCCQDMLIYLSRIIYTEGNGFDTLEPEVKVELVALHKSMAADWEKFKEHPEFLYDTLE